MKRMQTTKILFAKPAPREPRHLRVSWTLRALVALVFALILEFNPYSKPQPHILMGIAIVILGLWPLDAWLRTAKPRTIPVFEFHMLFYALSFGFAAFIDLPTLLMTRFRVNEQSYTLALIAVLLALISLYVGYFAAIKVSGSMLTKISPRFPVGLDRAAISYLYPALLVASVIVKELNISALSQIVPTLRLFTFTWAMCAALSGRVPAHYARVTLFIILPVEIIIFSGLLNGYLIGLLTYGELVIICFTLCKKRIPVVFIILAILVFVAIQPIKSHFRNVVWYGSTNLSSLQRADLLIDSASTNAEETASHGDVLESLEKSYARINHLGDTSGFIQSTEATDDYLYGATLVPIFTKWVPRVIWPDKPVEDIANSIGRKYGFLDQHDFITSLNLPWIAEMFLNFGWPGIVLLSVLVGVIIRLFKNGIARRASTPVELAFAYSIASGFFMPESNMSIGFGNMIISWISMSLFLVCLRALRCLHRHHDNRISA